MSHVTSRTTSPPFVNASLDDRTTGSVILVVESTNRTVGAAVLTDAQGG